MGRKSQLLLQYQPAAGVNTDFEQLLQRFTATETVRFEKFAEVWREMKMSFIFAGRDSERECREFTEEILKIALKYVLPPYNFQVRVGGLYLLYGLFTKQPLVRKARIRVTPDKWKEIIEFQTEARRQQHLDVNYVFHKLRFDDAFTFVATEDEVTFYLSTGGNIKDEDTTPDEFKDEQSVLYELFSDQFLEQLTQLHDHYHRVKVGLEGPDATEPSRSLNVIQMNIVPSIMQTVVAYQQRKQHQKRAGMSDNEQDITDNEDTEDIEVESKNIKSSLKAKAYRNVAKANRSRRHRQAVDSADDSPEKHHHRGRKKKSLSDSESPSSPKKRKVGRKKTIKKEEVEEIEEVIPNQEISKTEAEVQNEAPVMEVTPGDVLHMPSFEMEPSTSGTQKSPTQKKPGRAKAKQKASLTAQNQKKLKGKMPSVKLQPLQRKGKTPRKKMKT